MFLLEKVNWGDLRLKFHYLYYKNTNNISGNTPVYLI